MKDSLGDRIKKNYEGIYNIKLPRRMPMIIRLDGKAFHTYTKNCEKPFDKKLISLMQDTTLYLCNNIQGSQIAYVQSDEISILVHDYKKLTSSAWFDKEIQKICSVSAGMASAFFSLNSGPIFANGSCDEGKVRQDDLKLAVFDSRVFILPEAEVCNYFIWRQQDASRNSVQMLARSLYSHKECNNKNNSQLQEMIFQKGQNWDEIPVTYKRGSCIRKKSWHNNESKMAWWIDNTIPIFTQNRNYINHQLVVEET